jgi:hypothetical protein
LSQSNEAKASIIRMFIEEINKIDVNNVSSASRSVVCLFKTLTKGLSDPVEDDHDGGRNLEPGQLFIVESFEDKDWSAESWGFIMMAHCEAFLASYAKHSHFTVTGDQMPSLKDLSMVRSCLLASNLICV